MLKMINELFILTFTIAIVICIMQYLKNSPERRISFFRQAGVLLLYGYWKLRITLSYAMEALKKNTIYALTSYQPSQMTDQTVKWQEQHLEHLKTQLQTNKKAYGKRAHNLKILSN